MNGGGGRGNRGGRGYHSFRRNNGGRGRRGGGVNPSPPSWNKNDASQHNFYCCSCERGFKTQEQSDEHNKEHIVCGLDGCQFEGHSLVVTKHIRIQHEGNLYQRMKNLNTPEDIERWRQERKKNFPTATKAQEKDDEMKEKMERREICGISGRKNTSSSHPPAATFRYKIQKHDPRSASYAEYKRQLRIIDHEQSNEWMHRPFAPDINERHVRVPFFSMNQSKIVYLENFYMNVKMGKDGSLKKQTKVKWKGFKAKELDRLTDSESEAEEAAIPISDDEEDYDGGAARTDTAVERVIPEQPLDNDKGGMKSSKNMLGNLMLVDYSSASDSEQEDKDSNETDAPEEKMKVDEMNENTGGVSSTTEVSDDHGLIPGVNDNSTQKKIESDVKSGTCDEDAAINAMIIEEFTKKDSFKDKPVFLKPHFKSRKGWFRTKLLETLLQDQIRKERNILLQTCRFVRENNFFGHN